MYYLGLFHWQVTEIKSDCITGEKETIRGIRRSRHAGSGAKMFLGALPTSWMLSSIWLHCSAVFPQKMTKVATKISKLTSYQIAIQVGKNNPSQQEKFRGSLSLD